MDNADRVSAYQDQMNSKPRIDDLISKNLQGEPKAESQDFIEFIKAQKMTPQWYAADSFSVSYKNKRVCIIKIHDGAWWIWSYTRYDEAFNASLTSEIAGIKELVMNNLVFCCRCGQCAPGEDVHLLGNSLHGVCRMPVIRFENPDHDTVNYAKRLVTLRRHAIANNEVPKVSYISVKKRNSAEK
jgi:hypothetical protein